MLDAFFGYFYKLVFLSSLLNSFCLWIFCLVLICLCLDIQSFCVWVARVFNFFYYCISWLLFPIFSIVLNKAIFYWALPLVSSLGPPFSLTLYSWAVTVYSQTRRRVFLSPWVINRGFWCHKHRTTGKKDLESQPKVILTKWYYQKVRWNTGNRNQKMTGLTKQEVAKIQKGKWEQVWTGAGGHGVRMQRKSGVVWWTEVKTHQGHSI